MEERFRPAILTPKEDAVLQTLTLHDRLRKLDNSRFDLRNPSNIKHLEEEPAYLRRQVSLENERHASNRSRLSVDKGASGNRFQLRDNNSYLYDNVD